MSTTCSIFDEFFDQLNGKLDKACKDLDFIKSKLTNDVSQFELFTPKEAAVNLKCCERTVYNMIWNGKLSAIRVGRKIYVRAEELKRIKTNGTPGNR